MTNVAVIGCGYVGLPLARELVRTGASVIGTTTQPDKIGSIEAIGAEARVLTLADADAVASAVEGADTVYVTVAAGRGGDYREVYVKGLQAVVAALDRTTVKQVIYTSATSVYGRDDGGWVDGDSPADPTTDRGRLLLEAEGVLHKAPSGVAVCILRLAGIWGPGRDPSDWMARRGPVIPGDGTGYLNLIHRDDIVAALLAAAKRRVTGVFTLADDAPTRRRDLYPALAARMGLEAPGFADSPPGPEAVSGKRVSNEKALKALGLRLIHPTGPQR